MNFKRSVGFLALQCALVALGNANAQQGGSTVLPEVTVTGNALPETGTGPVQGYVAKRSMSGTKTDTPLIEVPQSISIITRDEMDARGAQSTTEALRYTPGVAVDNFGNEGRGYEYLYIRGFDALNTGNFRDGLNQLIKGRYLASFISESYGYERIDVLRGPASVLFGQGDAGGIVNRVSKMPRADHVNEVGIQIGNFNRKQLTADLGGKLNEDGTLLYRLVALGLDTDTQTKFGNGQRGENSREYFAPSITWKPSADTSLTVLADFMRNRSGASPFYVASPTGRFTGLPVGDPSFVNYAQDQTSIGYRFEHKLNDTWTFRQNFRYMELDLTARDIAAGDLFGNMYAPDGRTLFRNARLSKERITQNVLDTQLQAKLKSGSVEHTVLVGVDWNKTKADLNLNGSLATPGLDILNPVYNQSIPEPDFLLYNGRQNTQQFGVYAQDQIKLDPRWLLTLGLRHDSAKSDTSDAPPAFLAGSSSQSDSKTTGRAGLTHLFGNGWAAYASYAESFNPVAVADTGLSPVTGRAFKPTLGKQYEIGAKYQPANGKTFFSAALFDLTKSNVITYQPPFGIATQLGEVNSRGIELEAKTELMRRLNLIASYTYNDVKITETANPTELDKTPARTPKTMASVWLDYAFAGELQGFSIGAGARYVGKVYNTNDNTTTTPSFTLFDAGANYDRGAWRFSLNVANLTNKKYVSAYAPSANIYYPGSERTVIASMKYRF